jgi:hypothetical protein
MNSRENKFVHWLRVEMAAQDGKLGINSSED